MIVKFHARGKGGGSGPVDYLLGWERNREGARVLRGAPEEVRELIDATPFAKKYTSGVLSFAEQTLPPGERERVMESFERVLMPGLEKNQYSILWVEHQDKGRLELNFVIPNMELASGKRLQPYYDRADRPRINAWQTLVNHHYGLHDPNAPENRRTLVTPNNLPKAKQEAAEAITRGLEALYHAGALKTRQDVTEALTAAGFEVVRTTRSSISIADPEGGRNLRLKGALYEQSFTNGDRLREETERACRLYREHAEQRVQEARSVCRQGTELKRAENQRRYQRTHSNGERTTGDAEQCRERAVQRHRERTGPAAGRAALEAGQRADTVPVADGALRHGRDFSGVMGADSVAGKPDCGEHPGYQGPGRDAGETPGKNMGCDVSRGQEREISGVAVRGEGGKQLDGGEEERSKTGQGVSEYDRAGNALTERLRAIAAGLYAAAERLGERLHGFAAYVRADTTGERATEGTVRRLESAGAEISRAGGPLESVIYHEQQIRDEQERQARLERERARSWHEEQEREARVWRGPSIGM